MDSDFSLGRLERLLTISDVTFRHDVDYHPWCAVKMAEFEQNLGVKATFFLMLRSPGYNMFSRELSTAVETILECGHKIGLHVDLGMDRGAEVSTEILQASCEWDWSYLGSLYPFTRKVSFHAPPRSALWMDVPGFDNMGGSRWSGRYIADSRGVWRQSPEDFLRNTADAQLNAHPEWWFLPPHEAQTLRERELAKP